MISYAIQAAKDSNLFDIIHVSTDSDEISSIAKSMGIAPDFPRPSNLSGDHNSMMEVLKFVVDTYSAQNIEFDTVSLVYATSPLLDPQDLKKACNRFEKGDKRKALLAVAAFPAPIEQAFTMNEDYLLIPNNVKGLNTRTQDLKKSYYDAGMFCYYTASYIKKQYRAGNFNEFLGYPVPSWRVTDIDWPEDWEHAEKMFQLSTLHYHSEQQ